jgi:hypothetical protein
MLLELNVSTGNLRQALELAPKALARHMDSAIGRITQEMADAARLKAPEAFGQLRQSIRPHRPSLYEGIIAPAVDYARMVEEGTPGGGPPPPPNNILDWVRRKHITPRQPGMTETGLARLIARSIAVSGTPAQPYLRPAFEQNRESAGRRIDAAIDAALREARA